MPNMRMIMIGFILVCRGMLQNTNDGVIIRPLELYSKPNSERRPKLKMKSSNEIDVLMDKGPINDYK
ncbi:hypothetical protein BsIDN1_70640 [Bacillus safensis]|uniref:Uncharacterized protein n=1 Tax=Bacillus safensis TaxID=561879 RepID=A0A5S9MNV0_BACIA|nr:hypothetical protein BsIDN1_70640 [Bacillus safensis]